MDTTTSEAPRDSRGVIYNAPSWSGDLTTLTGWQLHDRIEHLSSHIGRVSTVRDADGTWRAATAAELRERRFDHWVRVRVAALMERERRDG